MGVEVLAIAALATAVVGTGYSIYQGERANDYQQQAAKSQRKQQDLQAARERADAIRQARKAAAVAGNNAANQNVTGSSSAEGGQAGIKSQLSSNLSFLDQWNAYSDQASTALGNMRQSERNANLGSQVAGLAMQTFASAPQIHSSFSKIFAPKGTP